MDAKLNASVDLNESSGVRVSAMFDQKQFESQTHPPTKMANAAMEAPDMRSGLDNANQVINSAVVVLAKRCRLSESLPHC